ncbi:Nucleotide-binding universal stress protein, UspA family [Micromonospora rhizosphaerae]|uniref:Universal stress protein n=1 Tax=Micromonospora rhizosphaerae TaxID=568872 RepID=A0A1C6RZJ5_9ACTN|nr:universal stress protein [Micromonospora rhizosphaerae]SCL22520.1 Nucleotide-binding universal stress protein, UspA family [Micromonospora rhizosphaerae]
MYQHILAAVDATPISERVLDAATALATAFGATVHVVHIDESEAVYDRVVDLEDDTLARNQVAVAKDRLRASGVPATGEVVDGLDTDVPALILDTAHAHGADLVILGPHHRAGLARLLQPSVSDHVGRRADVALLLVR